MDRPPNLGDQSLNPDGLPCLDLWCRRCFFEDRGIVGDRDGNDFIGTVDSVSKELFGVLLIEGVQFVLR